MPEHEHRQTILPEESTAEPKPQDIKKYRSDSQAVALSILAGSIIIAASVFFGGRLIAQHLDNLTAAQQSLLSAGSTAAAPQAAPGQPSAPVTLAYRSNQPVEGQSGVKVTLVEFGDFQCPFCQSFTQNSLPQIKSQYIDTGKINLIFRHFPLPFHVNAQISAVAAECANQQGKFWPYHDLLYKNAQSDGTNLDKASLEKYADQLGLNNGLLGFGKNKFNQCLESNATLAVVQGDTAEGTKVGVNGTPSFLIIKNGQTQIDAGYIKTQEAQNQSVIALPNGDVFIVGAQPFSTFQAALDKALQQ